MQSVLRPSQRDNDSDNRPAKPKARRRRSAWRRNFAAILFSAVGLWLVGGVAWWHVQRWQAGEQAATKLPNVPAHRITMDEQPLRR